MLARLKTGACEKRVKTGTCVGCEEFNVCTKLERIEESTAMRHANDLSMAVHEETGGDPEALRRVLTRTMFYIQIFLGCTLTLGVDADGNGIVFDLLVATFNWL